MSGRKPNNYVFVLSDKLPTMHEAAISIYSVSKKDSESRDKAVHAYAVALQDVWHKSFGEKHVISLKPIKKRLRDILTSYNRNVLLESYRKTAKAFWFNKRCNIYSEFKQDMAKYGSTDEKEC